MQENVETNATKCIFSCTLEMNPLFGFVENHPPSNLEFGLFHRSELSQGRTRPTTIAFHAATGAIARRRLESPFLPQFLGRFVLEAIRNVFAQNREEFEPTGKCVSPRLPSNNTDSQILDLQGMNLLSCSSGSHEKTLQSWVVIDNKIALRRIGVPTQAAAHPWSIRKLGEEMTETLS